MISRRLLRRGVMRPDMTAGEAKGWQESSWRRIPLGVKMMLTVAFALFAMAFTMVGVQAQTSSNTVCQPVALPLSGAETRAVNSEPTLNREGSRAAFWSTANPIGSNNDRSIEIFWADTSALTDTVDSPINQVTNSRGNILGGFNVMPDMVTYISVGNVQRSFVVFASDRDYAERNADGGFEIFLAQTEPEQHIWQLTNTSRSASIMPTLSNVIDGRYLRIAYLSDADSAETMPRGTNADRNYEVHTMRVDLSPLDRTPAGAPVVALPIQVTFTSLDTVNDQPVVSGDGTKVVWLSNASAGIAVENTLENSDRNREVFVTTVASPTVGVQVTKSTQGDNDAPDINDDGTRITFESTVNNYPANGVFGTSTVGPQSVYIARLTQAMSANSITGFSRVSQVVRAPTGRTVTAKEPAISGDGRRVVFAADGCDPAVSASACNQPEGIYQVFVVDQQLSSPTNFTIARVTNEITRTHDLPAVSGDGQRIALVTTQDAGLDNPDLSGSEIVALECRVARLGATKSVHVVSPSLLENRPDVGDEIAFSIKLENTTFADFSGTIVLTDTLPPGLTYLTASVVSAPDGTLVALNPSSYHPASRRLAWSVTNLPKLTEAVVEIRARVNANQAGFSLTNRVQLAQTGGTPLEEQGITNFEPEASVTFRVSQVDLRSSMTVSTQVPRESEVFTYTVSVVNPQSVPPGSSGRAAAMDPATNVRLTTTLHSLLNQMNLVRVSTTGVTQAASFNSSTGVLTIPRIDGGQTAEVHIAMSPKAGAGGQPPRTARISAMRSDQEDINNNNNFGTVARTIRVLGTDLAAMKVTASQAIPPQNSSISFKLDMRNLGPLPVVGGSRPPTDTIYTGNVGAFVPALVEAHAIVPPGISVTGVSDGGIATPSGGGTEITWQVPGWSVFVTGSTPLTRSVSFTGVVTAAPGTELTVQAGDLSAFFPPPSSQSMNDPDTTNNILRAVTVRVNAPAEIGEFNPDSIDEGEQITLTVSYTDTDLLDTHTITVRWGDGTQSTSPVLTRTPPGSVSGTWVVQHIYADDPANVNTEQYTIEIDVADNTGNVETSSAVLTVRNVEPTPTYFNITGYARMALDNPSAYVALVNQPISITAAFTDPGYTANSTSEIFTYLVEWPQDGSTSSGAVTTVTNGSFGTPTRGRFNVNKTFTAPSAGAQVASVYAKDDDEVNPTLLYTRTIVVDQRPVANVDTLMLNEGMTDVVEVLLNDTDNNQPSLSVISVVTSTLQGTLLDWDETSGVFTYLADVPDLSLGEVFTDTMSYTIQDNVGLTATTTVRFVVTGLNDPPVVDLNGDSEGIDINRAFVEDAGAITLAPSGDVFDPDSNEEIERLRVQIMNPLDGGLEELLASGEDAVSLDWDAETHTLLVEKLGGDTPDWVTILRSVEYTNTSPNPTLENREIQFVATDSSNESSVVAHAFVSVQDVDDTPFIVLAGTALPVTETVPALVDTTAVVSDSDTYIWDEAVLTATVNSATPLDHLRVASGGDVTVEGGAILHNGTPIASYTGEGTGQIVITFAGDVSAEQVTDVARQIEYLRDTGASGGDRTISMRVQSVPEGPISEVATRTLAVTYINDAPTIALGTITVVEDTPLNIRSSLTISDPDAAANALRMRLQVSSGQITVAGMGASLTGNNSANVLITGTLTVLNSGAITYTPASNIDTNFTLTVTVNDRGFTGTGGAQVATEVRVIDITPVNDAPVLDLNGGGTGTGATGAYTEGQGFQPIVENDLSITDVDSATMMGARAAFSVLDTGFEFLTTTVSIPGITSVYDSEAGVLTLSGVASREDYETVLRSLSYRNTDDDPNTTARAVAVTVTDAANAVSNTATATVNITAVNDAPVLDLNGATAGISNTVQFVEAGGNRLLANADFTLTDPDNTTLSSAVITLTNRLNGTDEKLVAATNLGVTVAAYNTTNGRLELSGVASLATYRAVLATVAYTNTNNAPNLTDRIVVWEVRDSAGVPLRNSPRPVTTIQIQDVNDAPILDLNGNTTGINFSFPYTEGDGAEVIVRTGTNGLTVTDIDSANMLTATVVISEVLDGSAEQLSATPTGGFTIGYDEESGTLLITGNQPRANWQTLLRSVTYQHTSEAPTPGARIVRFTIWDSGGTPSVTAVSTVTVSAVNDRPVITLGTLPTIEEDVAVNIGPVLTITDVDAGSGNLRLTLGVTTGTLTTTADSLAGMSGSGTATLVMTGTLAQLNAKDIFFKSTLNGNGNNALTINASDLGNSPAPAQTAVQVVRNFTVAAVNDAPVLTLDALPGINEDVSTRIDGAFAISDVDAASGNLRLRISVETGVLTTTATALAGREGNGTESLVITGTLSQLNGKAIFFKSLPNVNGSNVITLTASDLGNSPGPVMGAVPVTRTFTVTAVNDAPVLTFGTLTGVQEDVAVDIGPLLTIADVDAEDDDLRMRVSVASGTITATADSLTGIEGSGTASMVMTGTLAQLNAKEIFFKSLLNINGSNTITITASDLGHNPGPPAGSNNIVQAFTVAAVNDAPVITFTEITGIEENAPASTNIAEFFSVADVDVAATQLRMQVSVAWGTLSVSGGGGVNTNPNNASTIVMTGTLTALNAKEIAFTAPLNASGPNTITVTVSDRGGTGAGGAQIGGPTSQPFTVAAVNDAPTVVIAPITGVAEDTPIDLGQFITAADSDAGSGQLRMEVAVDWGTLTASGTGIVANPNGEASIVVTGTLTDLNAGVILFTPTPDLSGANSITVTVNDLGNTGTGGALSSGPVDSAFTVAAVNDAPVITFASITGVAEDTPIDMAQFFSISDIDAGSGDVRMRVTVAWGTLTASGTGVVVDPNAAASVVMTGTVAELNASTIQFAPTPDVNGTNTLTVTVNDLGNTGSGGLLVAGPTPSGFTVQPANDAPTLETNAGMAETYVLTDTLPVDFVLPSGSLVAADIDGDPASALIYNVKTLPTNGSLVLNGTPLTACPAAGSSFTQADLDNGLVAYRLETYAAAVNTGFDFVLANGADCGTATGTYEIDVAP